MSRYILGKEPRPGAKTHTHTHLFFISESVLQLLYGLVEFSLLGFDDGRLVALALELRHLKTVTHLIKI